MKNKSLKKNADYRQMRTSLFIRITAIVVIFVFIIVTVYLFLVRGRFREWIVTALQRVFSMEFLEAQQLYLRAIYDNIELLVAIFIAVVFFIIIRIYLNWFTKYFIEINEGIDALLKEDEEDVRLSRELTATEKKINTIKHTLHKRKIDTQSAEQRKNDLVVYLAHDLKTPLTSVIGYLTLLRDETEISPELREKYLSISLDKAERLEDLINEFFEITRFNLSDITLQYSQVNLTRLLEQLVFEFKPMFLEKRLDCKLKIPADLTMKCDINKIQRVFDNLLRNAVFYSYEDTTIEITVTQNEKNTTLAFLNHGDTIPSEKLEQIFEQFYRLDTSRSSRQGGAGLGLAIAKEIVELHLGSITAKSDASRITFTVTLPTM